MGSGSRSAGRRSAGRGGRQVAPAGALRSLRGQANRLASQGGRGRRARQQLLADIDAASRRSRGGARLTNQQVNTFRERLRALLRGGAQPRRPRNP